MLYRLSKPLRRGIAVALAVGAFALAGVAVIGPVTARVASLSDDVAQERMVLGRLNALTADAKADDGAATAGLSQSGQVVKGSSAAIRQAALQSQLAGLVAAQGLKPRSAHALPPRDRGSLKLIGTQVQLVANMESVQRVMTAIEDHQPALFIDAVDIVRSSQSGLPNDDDDDMLDARIAVYAVAKDQ